MGQSWLGSAPLTISSPRDGRERRLDEVDREPHDVGLAVDVGAGAGQDAERAVVVDPHAEVASR